MTEDNPYKLHEFVAHSTQVNCVTIGPQSIQVLATGGEDSKVNIWRIDNALNIWTLKQNKSSIESLCFDNDEQYLCSGAMNGSLKIFDLNEGKLARNLRGHQVNVTSIHYHPYGEFIVSGSYDNSMKVWDIRNKSCVQTYTGHDREVTCTKFSPDGRWVSSSSKDGQLLIWDLVAGKLLKTIKLAQNAYLTSFEFNPCEFLLAGATSNRSVRFWDLEMMEEIGHTTPDSTTVRSICYAEEGTKLCTANNETLRLWNWDPSVTLLHNYNIGWDRIQDMKICNHNPSEHVIGISSNSNFVSIWDVDIGSLHEQSLSSIEVSEDRGVPIPNAIPIPGSVRDRSNSNSSNSNRKSANTTPASASAGYGSGARMGAGAGAGTGIESDDDNDSYSSYGNGNGRKPPALKVDGYFSSPDKKPSAVAGIGAGGAALETVPEVLWESGHSTNDLATSISQSKYRHDHDHDSSTAAIASAAKEGRSNPSNVIKQETDERANHDRFVPSANPRYPQGRRPVTREKDRDSSASVAGAGGAGKKGDKQRFEVAPANTPEIGLSVVGRPMTSSENREKREEDTTPPKQQPSRYVVNSNPSQASASENRKASDLDRVEQGQERDPSNYRAAPAGAAGPGVGVRDRSDSSRDKDKGVRRIHSESNMPYNSNPPPVVPNGGLKRDYSLQSISSSNSHYQPLHQQQQQQQPVGFVPAAESASSSAAAVAASAVAVAARDAQEIDTLLTLVITQSDLTTTILQQRYEILRQLQTYWKHGEISAISETLLPLLNSFPLPSQSSHSNVSAAASSSSSTLSLLLVFSDFMNSIDFHSPLITLTTCPLFLSLFQKYLSELCRCPSSISSSSSSAPVLSSLMISILQATQALYQIFRQIIHETRVIGSVSHGNIDMAREERLEKCNVCYRHFVQIRDSTELLREKYRKHRDLIDQFQRGLSDLDD